jgi:hypothetical protein
MRRVNMWLKILELIDIQQELKMKGSLLGKAINPHAEGYNKDEAAKVIKKFRAEMKEYGRFYRPSCSQRANINELRQGI